MEFVDRSERLTCGSLRPAADLVHGGCAEEEEQREASDAGDHQHHGHPDEEGGSLEGSGRDGGELGEAALAGQLPGDPVPDAIVKEPEVAGLRRVHAIADPIGLREDSHVHDAEQDGEYSPQESDHAGVSDVIGLVQFGSFCRR